MLIKHSKFYMIIGLEETTYTVIPLNVSLNITQLHRKRLNSLLNPKASQINLLSWSTVGYLEHDPHD